MHVCTRICIDDGFNLKSFVKKTLLLFLFSLFLRVQFRSKGVLVPFQKRKGIVSQLETLWWSLKCPARVTRSGQ